jgi:hypothetical protein
VTDAAMAMRASETILARKQRLAQRITDALYATDPALHERFGDAGRAKCLQDMDYCLEHLAPAVALEDPTLFARYVLWLEQLLAVRSVGSEDVRRSLEATQEILAKELSSAEAAFVRPCVAAGLAALSQPLAT